MKKTLNFIIKFSIYSLVFLIPLLWLPWTVEAHEFNKQYALLILTLIGLLAWLAKMVFVRKHLHLRRTRLDIWILALTLLIVLSSLFSIDRASSWLGSYGRFSNGSIGFLAGVIVYFILVNNTNLKKQTGSSALSEKGKFKILSAFRKLMKSRQLDGLSIERILNLFLISSGLAVFTALFSVFGFWSKIPGLPRIMASRSFNPVAGSLEGLAIFLVVLVSALVGLFLSLPPKITAMTKRTLIGQVLRIVLLIGAIFLLAVIDFKMAWLVLALVMFSLLAVAFWTGLLRQRANWLSLPIVVLLIAVFYFSGLAGEMGLSSQNISPDLPSELILDQGSSWRIAYQSIKEYPVLGSGPATFMVNFTKFKPSSINNTNFWNIRFDQPASYFIERVATTGVPGTLLYLLLLVVFLLFAFISLKRLKNKQAVFSNFTSVAGTPERQLVFLPCLSAFLGLAIAQFVYPQNTVLFFYFWVFLALTMIIWRKMGLSPRRKVSFSLEDIPEAGLVASVILLILILASMGAFYFSTRLYLADFQFKRLVEQGENLVENMQKIVGLNKYRDKYRRDLSQVYLAGAWKELAKTQESQDLGLLQKLITNAIEQAKIAVDSGPNSVQNWENLAMVYRDAQGLVNGVLPFALDAFSRASELEPINPLLYREQCRLSLMREERNWDEIVNYCQKAIELKPNYLDARMQLALVFEERGDLEKAASEMEATLAKLKGVSFQRGSDIAQAATEIYFQLGRIYFNLKNFEEAVQMFEQSVIVNPQYANARYGLALAYREKARYEDALVQLKIVNELVPNNERVLELIGQLKAVEAE